MIIIDFGKGIIVKNRFETYKDYFDVENLLKKLWYGEELGNNIVWNPDTQEFEWLLSGTERDRVDPDLVGDEEKVKIMQTLLSSFMKIKKGMQHLYEKNCESQEFRDYRDLLKKQQKEKKKSVAKNQMNTAQVVGGQGDNSTTKMTGGYNKEAGPNVLGPRERILVRVDESTLDGYDLKDVENTQQFSFEHVGDIINKYQTDMANLKRRK